MRVNHVVERPDGEVVFQAELTGAELAAVIETGLNYLLQQGALPFLDSENKDIDTKLVHSVPNQVQ